MAYIPHRSRCVVVFGIRDLKVLRNARSFKIALNSSLIWRMPQLNEVLDHLFIINRYAYIGAYGYGIRYGIRVQH